MKLCYQVATPDVKIAESVTAYQGSLEKTFGDIAKLGYDGVELMTLNPGKLDWDEVKKTAEKHNLIVGLVCTGEIFGQLNLCFTDPDKSIREEAINRVKEIIDFASFLGANINIGRVRGYYRPDVDKKQTDAWAVAAFKEISEHAKPKGVIIALETVTIMQTNFINTMEEGLKFVELVDHENFKLMIDVFHLNIEEKDLYKAIKQYIPYTIHVHLADNNRRYPGNCGMDFKKIIQLFHDNGFDGTYCTEIYQDPTMEIAAAESIKYLGPIFKEVYGRIIKA
jgi:sugar phosphate isomerase/epimerase